MKSIIQNSFYVVLMVLALDFGFYAMWQVSGQKPVDEFYFGTITAHAIGAGHAYASTVGK